MTPRVSVIIPTYNRPQKTIRAVDSVLAQTLNSIEIIVVDDGSTDDTVYQLKKTFGNKIILISIPHTGNPNYPRNVGVANAKANLVAFLDSDDWYLPEKVETQVNYLERHPEFSAVYCDMMLADPNGQILSDSWFKDRNDMKQGTILKQLLVPFRPLGYELYLNWLLFSKDIFKTIGLFSTRLSFLEDWEFVLRMALRYKIGCIKKSLLVAERNDGNNYSQRFVKDYHAQPALYTLPILHSIANIAESEYQTIRQAIIAHCIISANRQAAVGSRLRAWRYWRKAFVMSPCNPIVYKYALKVGYKAYRSACA
ncbi:glycosyltransferase [candidate division KSB1 bacterium]|nr:glycosyltransferase [candidate division KSB1 bacterium]